MQLRWGSWFLPRLAIHAQSSYDQYRRSISRADRMSDRVLRQVLTGFIRLHILYHADKEPICGVEIMEELRRHGYSVGPGTLYPILQNLHDGGYLSLKTAIQNGKR